MTIGHILPHLVSPTISLNVRVHGPDLCRAPQFPRHAVAPLCARAIPLGIAGWPRFRVCSRDLGGGSGHAGTRPERRPRRQDRGGRQDAAPRHPGIGPNATNPFTVFEITGEREQARSLFLLARDPPGRLLLPIPLHAMPSPSSRPAGLASSTAPPFFPPQPTLDRLAPLALLHRLHLPSSPLGLTLDRLTPPTLLPRLHLPRRDSPVCPRASP